MGGANGSVGDLNAAIQSVWFQSDALLAPCLERMTLRLVEQRGESRAASIECTNRLALAFACVFSVDIMCRVVKNTAGSGEVTLDLGHGELEELTRAGAQPVEQHVWARFWLWKYFT